MSPPEASTIESEERGASRFGWWVRRNAWRAIIAGSGLPTEVQEMITRVTRSAGGSSRERVETASELVSHFVEAFEHGATPSDAVRAFGDERQAARLLRRAIRRKRGLVAKAWWWSSRAAACAIAVTAVAYAGLAIRFYSAQPTIAVHSLDALHALEPVAAPEEHAWPIYRPALIALHEKERALAKGNDPSAGDWFSTTDPTSASWERGTTLLREHADELDALRDGAQRAALGLRVGSVDPADADLFTGAAARSPDEASDDNPPIFGVLLPHLMHLRRAARWLGADALRAAHASDGARAVENIEAILGLARQCRRPLLVEQLVSLAVAGLAMSRTEQALALAPDAFDAALLTRLDAALAQLDDAMFTVDFRGETIGFEDFLQRAYTDDGAGDGHVTAQIFANIGGQPDPRARVLGPGLLLTMPSRRTLREANERSVDLASDIASRPPWTWRDEQTAAASSYTEVWGDMLLESLASPTSRVRAATAGPWARARRDMTRVIIALHRHRAERGAWPESLSVLVGADLPALPADPYTGESLRYAVREGQPHLWSVGEDGVDDRLSKALRPWGSSPLANRDETNTASPLVGDMQFWPPLRDE
jgi:hypothetical protein